VKRYITNASNLTPQAVRFFAKTNGAIKRPTCSAFYAGVMFFSVESKLEAIYKMVLREFVLEDKGRLLEILNDSDVTKYLSTKISQPYTSEDADWWITEGSKLSLVRAIEVDEKLVGCIGVNRGEFEYCRSGEIGYWLASDFCGEG
jgi:hypothetical protein